MKVGKFVLAGVTFNLLEPSTDINGRAICDFQFAQLWIEDKAQAREITVEKQLAEVQAQAAKPETDMPSVHAASSVRFAARLFSFSRDPVTLITTAGRRELRLASQVSHNTAAALPV